MDLNSCVSFTFYFLYCVHMCVCAYMYICTFAYVFVYICAHVCVGPRLMTGAFFGYPPPYSLRQSELTKLAGPSRHFALGNPLSLGVNGATVPAFFSHVGAVDPVWSLHACGNASPTETLQTLNSCLDVLFAICVICSKLFSLCSLYFLTCKWEESPKGLLTPVSRRKMSGVTQASNIHSFPNEFSTLDSNLFFVFKITLTAEKWWHTLLIPVLRRQRGPLGLQGSSYSSFVINLKK